MVIGIGNLLRADDGVGVHVVRKLRETRPDIDAVDLSTASIEMLEFIRGGDRVVIVDATKTGAEPGTIHRIAPEQLRKSSFTFSHGLNLFGVLILGQQLYPEEMPKEIVILAVEAEDVDSFGTELTEKVQAAVPKILKIIVDEFEKN